MSCVRKIRTFKEIKTIKIETLDKVQLEKIIEKIKTTIDQKFIKLKSILKNYYVWSNGNYLVVNDQYFCSSNHRKLWNNFNIQDKTINCQLFKGATFILTDPLLDLLSKLNIKYDFSRVLELQDQKTNVEKYLDVIKPINKKLQSILNKISQDGNLTLTVTRKVTVETMWGWEKRFYKDDWNLNIEKEYKEQINYFIDLVNEALEQAKQDLVLGTTKLISYKAECMGYKVKESKTQDKIQLVLERVN